MQEVADALRLDTELSADSAAYIEELYEQYLTAPDSVGADWRAYFDKFPKGDQPHSNVREQFLLLGRNSSRIQPIVQSTVSSEHERRQIGVLQLIAAYRNRGHQKAKLDPLGLAKREVVPDLDLAAHGLTQSDLDTVFNTGNLAIGKEEATLAEMVQSMEATYCGSIGAEYMH
ncbi:2-oxoglutarate dehydrogenase E1 component, partial [Klebsiella pneumoniae]|nr:2-oxoglutarate dehydrogenase E1 component [Klebsiella pneumoniae]